MEVTRPPEWAQSQYGDTMTEEAIAAKALSGTVIEGKSIDVRLKAEPRAPREDKFANAAPVNEAAKLYVAYMPENYGADELRMLLQPYGLPSDVRVISDRETGRSRGFGFAQMMDQQQAHSAIQGLNGQIIDGKQLVVRIAGDKPPPRQVHPYGGYNPYGAYPGYGDIIVLGGTDHVNSCKPRSVEDVAFVEVVRFLKG